METKNQIETECCPKLDPLLWDNNVFEWENKYFVKAKVFTFLYMPINFGRVMRRLDKAIRNANSTIPDSLGLSDHTSKWNMDIYLAVDKEVPGVENVSFTGKFYSKVYEGPFKDTGKWCADFDERAKERDFTIKKLYMWYTTCPKCAKKYGKNYVVIFGEIK